MAQWRVGPIWKSLTGPTAALAGASGNAENKWGTRMQASFPPLTKVLLNERRTSKSDLIPVSPSNWKRKHHRSNGAEEKEKDKKKSHEERTGGVASESITDIVQDETGKWNAKKKGRCRKPTKTKTQRDIGDRRGQGNSHYK